MVDLIAKRFIRMVVATQYDAANPVGLAVKGEVFSSVIPFANLIGMMVVVLKHG